MSIRKKLYFNFALILSIVLLLSVFTFLALQREHAARSASQRSFEVAQASEAIRFSMMQNRQFLSNYLLSGSTADANSLTEGMSKLQTAIDKAMDSANSQQRSILQKLSEAEREWDSNFARPLVEKRNQVDSGNATVNQLEIQYLQLNPAGWTAKSTGYVDELERAVQQDMNERRAADAGAAAWTLGLTILFCCLGLGAGVLIAFKTSTSIIDPLSQLIAVSREIGQSGDLDHQLDIRRKDEIGELASTFSNMVLYLKEMSEVSEAIAGGDLTVQIRPRSQRDTLALAFMRMVEGLRGLVSGVRDSAAQVSGGSNQVASASEESARLSVQASSSIDEVTSTMHEMSVNVQNMVKSTQMQSSSVSETSSSIDQMVASIQRVADTAKVLLDISQRSREEVQAGIATMQKTTDGLSRINSSIQTSSQIIDVLGNRADDIGKIIEVIDDLAEQTNLLALNAAIEAARAGEHGLGFAVVAEEVRKLAEKSATSTKEIAELIQSIQKEARRAVDNMEKSTGIVNEGLSLGVDLNAALRKISNVVTEVYKFAHEIGAATTEQSHGSTQIAKATTQLNELTHEISSAVEEQASGAQAVVMAMERMRELIQRFTSGSTELAASADQMSKMSRALIESMGRFTIDTGTNRTPMPHAYSTGRPLGRDQNKPGNGNRGMGFDHAAAAHAMAKM